MENLQPKRLASLSSVRPAAKPPRRTEWAEHHVEDFLSLPFISEFVFRDVRTKNGNRSGYEVALSLPGVGPAQAHVEAGQPLFGNLSVTSTALHLLPER
jgi:hypothetical protein